MISPRPDRVPARALGPVPLEGVPDKLRLAGDRAEFARLDVADELDLADRRHRLACEFEGEPAGRHPLRSPGAPVAARVDVDPRSVEVALERGEGAAVALELLEDEFAGRERVAPEAIDGGLAAPREHHTEKEPENVSHTHTLTPARGRAECPS